MFFIQKLIYNIGNFPVSVRNVKFQDGTINVIIGKNSSGKTSFCEALASCAQGNDVFVNRHKMNAKDFIYFNSNSPSFFGINGYELLRNYGGNAKPEQIHELINTFSLPYNNLIDTYSFSMKKLIQFMWLLTYERKLYLFDDLFASLDEENMLKIKGLLKQLKESGKIVLITTSSLELVEDIANDVYDIVNGYLKPHTPTVII